MVEGFAEVLGQEVAGEVGVEALEETGGGLVGLGEGLGVAEVGDEGVFVGGATVASGGVLESVGQGGEALSGQGGNGDDFNSAFGGG